MFAGPDYTNQNQWPQHLLSSANPLLLTLSLLPSYFNISNGKLLLAVTLSHYLRRTAYQSPSPHPDPGCERVVLHSSGHLPLRIHVAWRPGLPCFLGGCCFETIWSTGVCPPDVTEATRSPGKWDVLPQQRDALGCSRCLLPLTPMKVVGRSTEKHWKHWVLPGMKSWGGWRIMARTDTNVYL